MDSKVPNEPPPAYSESSNYSHPPPASSSTNGPEPPPYPAPPGLAHTYSSGANASLSEAQAADSWCQAYPLTPPFPLPNFQLAEIRTQTHTLLVPQHFRGSLKQTNTVTSSWRITSSSGCTDSLFQTHLPIYSYHASHPLMTERAVTIYFELRILSLGTPPPSSTTRSLFTRHKAASEESGVAIGFFAPPYPPFRLPGWQRGSLGVHSDDGRRYVSNPDGGVDFTTPFEAGETIGLGMNFEPQIAQKGESKVSVQVFFTRNGRKAGGWDLSHDTDMEWENVNGLMGENDVFPAMGVFGVVDVEVNFGEAAWLYRGWGR